MSDHRGDATPALTPRPYTRYQILLTQVPTVRGWCEGNHWRAELFDHGEEGEGLVGFTSIPLVVAYIGGVHPDSVIGPSLDYVHVPPFLAGTENSRRAIKHLIRSLHSRFPRLWHTDRIDAAGNRRGEAERNLATTEWIGKRRGRGRSLGL